jgi:hypothetical protein
VRSARRYLTGASLLHEGVPAFICDSRAAGLSTRVAPAVPSQARRAGRGLALPCPGAAKWIAADARFLPATFWVRSGAYRIIGSRNAGFLFRRDPILLDSKDRRAQHTCPSHRPSNALESDCWSTQTPTPTRNRAHPGAGTPAGSRARETPGPISRGYGENYFQPDFDGASGRLSGRTSAVRNMIESWAARSSALSAIRS